jgi:trk system potassium uptake protein TrkA
VYEIEVNAHAPATEHVLAKLPLPGQCLIAAIVREDFVRVPHADDRLQAGDTVVALIDDDAVDDSLAQFRVNGR